MSNDREVAVTHEQQVHNLTQRVVELEKLLSRALPLVAHSDAADVWAQDTLQVLPKAPRMTEAGRDEMIARCKRVGIDLFLAEGHIMSTTSITGRQLELLLIDLHKFPLSQSHSGE